MKSLCNFALKAIAVLLLGGSNLVLASDTELGRQLFLSDAQPMACALCHALQDAGATGNIGPDLDDLQPDAERMHKVLIEGMGAMPSFADSLSQDQRDAIVDYVISVTN